MGACKSKEIKTKKPIKKLDSFYDDVEFSNYDEVCELINKGVDVNVKIDKGKII